MRPPMLQGEYRDLQIAFTNAVGIDILLKSPESGNYRSAYVLYDIDADDEDEALVFYIKRKDKTVAHLNILDNNGKTWVSVSDIYGSGSDITDVEFADMNGDLLPEIIVSWRLYESEGNKVLTIFTSRKNIGSITVKKISTEPFTDMKPLDINSDDKNEIFLLWLDTTSEFPAASAKILKMQNDDTIVIASQVKLDGNIGSYTEIKAEKASEGYPMRIYIDANKGKMQMITEVVFWDNIKNKLVAPLLDKQTQSNIITWRSDRIPSIDINNDGIIEIPTQTILPGAISNISAVDAMPIYLTKWIQIRNNGTTFEVMQSVINSSDDYMFILPPKLYKKIAINRNIEHKQLNIYSLGNISSAQGALLFSIRAVPISKWTDEKKIYNGYTKILNNSSLVVGAYVSKAGKEMGIDFKFLNNYIVTYEGG